MLIVVEGASAARKTTWCRRFAADRALFEGEPATEPEPAGASGSSIASTTSSSSTRSASEYLVCRSWLKPLYHFTK